MNADTLLHKAHTALASAKLLLESGDADGACNRAYYAMFDAARAALMAFQNSDEVLTIKTHSGLISSFSLQLVKPGMIDIELGKALNKVEDLSGTTTLHALLSSPGSIAMGYFMVLSSFQSCLLQDLLNKSCAKVFFRVWNG